MASNGEYVGAIAIFAGSYTPKNWMLCDGDLLPIKDFSRLYSILGTSFGGDGVKDFALPDLRGRVPIGCGDSFFTQAGGFEKITLEADELAAHTHSIKCDTTGSGSEKSPAGNYFAQSNKSDRKGYSIKQNYGMAKDILSFTGGGKPHNNMQPFLAINYIICVHGELPPHSENNLNTK